MFTIFMMILSSLATLYFTKPGFKKAVKYFFSTKTELATPTSDSDSATKEFVDAEIPTLSPPVGKKSDLGWREWNAEDAMNQSGGVWTKQDEEDDGQRPS